MPYVMINYDSQRISDELMLAIVQLLKVELAKAVNTDDPGGSCTPAGVKIFAHPHGKFDTSEWELDVSVLTNDKPGRRNTQEIGEPVSQALDGLLKERAPGVAACLWIILQEPFGWFDPQNRLEKADKAYLAGNK